MNRHELFLAAMQALEFKRRAWVISAFALVRETPDAWKENPYPYRIVQTPTGHFYVSPDDTNKLVPIPGTKAGEPVLNLKEKVTIEKGTFINLDKTIETTYGNILANHILLIHPFGNKIPYMEGRFGADKIEAIILPRLKDDLEPGVAGNASDIYVSEYLAFCNAAFFLVAFTQLCVPAATRKTMTCSPDIVALKESLIEKNKDRLHDPAVIASIDAELVKHDREWMKGDLGEGFLIKKKSFEVVRKKLYGMHGAEVGLNEGIDVDLIQNSLSQGWDINKFPAMNNSLRAGSFNRGHQTMLGGESVKWLLRASSNIAITVDDCKSRLGITKDITGENYEWINGFSIITPDGSKFIPDAEAAKTYIGKRVVVRSPMFCNLSKTDYCKCCVGARLKDNPTGGSAAVAAYGGVFLAIYMKMAHGKALTLAKMDFKAEIN
jgi:hypothetical protein